MSDYLYGIFIQPLMIIYERLFTALPIGFGGEGGQIVLFSLVLNLALMPLYAQMERKSRAGRELRRVVAAEEARMKRHFKGRELYFYIRAVHRQFGYRPLSQLFGSADLLVQIVVFATVFHFLSNLELLNGKSYGLLRDLSAPDGLLGGINVLPFVMTAINAVSVMAYVQDPARRIQAWALSLLFLVLLYQSASGLVLYWTMNNLFSLVRTALQNRLSVAPGPWTRAASALQRQT